MSHDNSPFGEFLVVDYGLKRVGVARINSHAQIAEYLPVIQRSSDQQVIDELLDLAESLHAHGIVVGIPRTLSGGVSQQTLMTKEFIDTLVANAHNKVEVYVLDEAGTTAEAKTRAQKESLHNAGIDSIAAGIIAEDFIQQKNIAQFRYRG